MAFKWTARERGSCGLLLPRGWLARQARVSVARAQRARHERGEAKQIGSKQIGRVSGGGGGAGQAGDGVHLHVQEQRGGASRGMWGQRGLS